jgi:hypothetical protein
MDFDPDRIWLVQVKLLWESPRETETGSERMSDVENLEAEYRALASKLIYASFEGEPNPEDQARLDRLGEELTRLNAADFSQSSAREAVAA